MFAKILSNVDLRKPSQLGPRNPTERTQGVESFTGDAQDALRKYQDRIRDLEGKNATLKDLVEGLKSTFEFFELANDQYIMQKH